MIFNKSPLPYKCYAKSTYIFMILCRHILEGLFTSANIVDRFGLCWSMLNPLMVRLDPTLSIYRHGLLRIIRFWSDYQRVWSDLLVNIVFKVLFLNKKELVVDGSNIVWTKWNGSDGFLTAKINHIFNWSTGLRNTNWSG